jgi:hypothetical protein
MGMVDLDRTAVAKLNPHHKETIPATTTPASLQLSVAMANDGNGDKEDDISVQHNNSSVQAN